MFQKILFRATGELFSCPSSRKHWIMSGLCFQTGCEAWRKVSCLLPGVRRVSAIFSRGVRGGRRGARGFVSKLCVRLTHPQQSVYSSGPLGDGG